jgi:dihydropyrimidinase
MASWFTCCKSVAGITGPGGSSAFPPRRWWRRGESNAIAIADVLNVPIYVVHVSCNRRLNYCLPVRGVNAFTVEAFAGHLVLDDSVYRNPTLVSALPRT